MARLFKSALSILVLAFLGCTFLSAQSSQSSDSSIQQTPGSVAGTVQDGTGAVIPGASVKIIQGDRTQEAVSGANGQFSFANIAPGSFQLVITAAGFASQVVSGVLQAGEIQHVPEIKLAIAAADTVVQVSPITAEIAEEQVRVEEKQRVLKVIPNFYVSYIPDAAPLNSKQKFELAWKTLIDPIDFLVIGGVAGIEQSQNNFPGYGQGAQGYAKRYAASYGDLLSGTLIGAAILPSVLKQDPRYFYKGTGSKRSRVFYALANAVICKGDNGHWQANYSGILGSLAAGGLSNLYYSGEDRKGARLTFENAAVGIGSTGAINLFEEFLVKKFSSHNNQERAKQ